MSAKPRAIFDIAIIGGGINGCGVAADAALRGLSVVLLEKDDLAAHTSSASTKLIHGGLRYLEQYEFGLVKKALAERQRLLTLAPHLVHPQAFVLALQKKGRPAWLLRIGLFLYDHLSRHNRLPRSKSIHQAKAKNYFSPLKNDFNHGFLFYDAATDDARLTVSNARLAKAHGACICTQTEVVDIRLKDHLWALKVSPKTDPPYTLYAKALINAGGPYVSQIAQMMGITAQKMSLVQGSHLILPQLYTGNHGYVLEDKTKRIVFVIPYHGKTLIGTTETLFQGDLDEVRVSQAEIDYLLKIVNAYFKTQVSSQEILLSYSGIRPLLAHNNTKMSQLSRDYYFDIQNSPLPMASIYSGKITTYRQLAEELLDQFRTLFPHMKACKTKETCLPGSQDFANYLAYAKKRYDWLGSSLLSRYLYAYGSCTEEFMASCDSFADMGKHFGHGLYQVEVDYLLREEFAKTADDILKRRTHLYLKSDGEMHQALRDYLGQDAVY